MHNRTRRSVALDLSVPVGRGVARRLITAADVFVTNLRQKALTRLELDSTTLRAAAPQLVYAQVTGYGDADEENRRSYDHGAFWSYSGMAALFRDSAGTPPQPAGGMGDRASGSALAGAVCAALFARQRTGRGEHVSVSLLSTAMWLMASDAADALRTPAPARGNDRLSAPIPTVNCFRCADGRWLWLQSMLPERDWDALLTALDARWLDDDPRFSGGDGRLLAQGRAALTEALDEIFVIQVEAAGDGAQVFGFQVFASENEAVRGVIVDDHAAIAVEDSSARGGDGQQFNAIALGLLVIDLRVLHLQGPEAGDEEQEDDDGRVLKKGHFPGGELDVFPIDWLSGCFGR